MLLVEPMAAEELPDARIVRFPLWRLKGDKLVKVLVNGRGLARASI